MRKHLLGWGLACLITSNIALAQDGQPPVGPPVTAPGTDKANPPRTAPLPPRAQSSNEVLPPVPATASDPAPPGTRAVRVDTPVPVEAAPSPDPTDVDNLAPGAVAATGAAPRRSTPWVEYAEGVVTNVQNPGAGAGPDARFVITLDSWRTWDSYLAETGQAPTAPPPTRPLARAAQQVAKAARETAKQAAKPAEASFPDDRPREMTLVLTPRSQFYRLHRTPDGMDLYGAIVAAAPGMATTVTGPLGNGAANIVPGSFVAVRYRPMGGQNVVLNLNVISPAAASSVPATVGGRVAGVPRPTVPGRSPVPAGIAAPVRPLPDPTLAAPPAPGVNPTRIPRVPTAESSPGTLPH